MHTGAGDNSTAVSRVAAISMRGASLLFFCFYFFMLFLCYFFCLVSRAASRSVVRVNRGNVVAVLVVKLTGKLFFFNSINLLKF